MITPRKLKKGQDSRDLGSRPKMSRMPVRSLNDPDDNFRIILNLILDTYIVCRNMSHVYDMYRRVTMGEDYSKIATNGQSAAAWFKKPENQEYIMIREREINRQGFDAFCKEHGIEHAEFKRIESEALDEISDLTPNEIRDKNYLELEVIKTKTDDLVLKSNIIKQQSELMGAKLKDNGMQLSEEDKTIHFYLPAPYCDSCPRKCEIEEQYEHLPEIDLDIPNDTDYDEERD